METEKIKYLSEKFDLVDPMVEEVASNEANRILDNTLVKGEKAAHIHPTKMSVHDIRQFGMAPKFKISHLTIDFYVSEPFFHEGKLYCYLYALDKQNFVVRTLYQSSSHALFTLLYDYAISLGNWIARFSKGNGQTSLRLALPLQLALAKTIEASHYIEYADAKIAKFLITGPAKMTRKTSHHSSHVYNALIQNEASALRGFDDFFTCLNDGATPTLDKRYFAHPYLVIHADQADQNARPNFNQCMGSFLLLSPLYAPNDSRCKRSPNPTCTKRY